MISRHLNDRTSALSKLVVAGACLFGSVCAVTACDAGNVDPVLSPATDAPLEKGADAPTTSTPSTSTEPSSPALAGVSAGDYLDFVGAWASEEGPISVIVFESVAAGGGHRFFAHTTGLSNAAAGKRTAGTYVPGVDTLVLDAGSSGVSGTYAYAFSSPNDLVLGSGASAQVFTRLTSYCDQASDCPGQGIDHVACTGTFACTEKHTCNWVCEIPVEPPQGPPCGKDTVCGADQVCCNASCGICTKPGDQCSKKLCPQMK